MQILTTLIGHHSDAILIILAVADNEMSIINC